MTNDCFLPPATPLGERPWMIPGARALDSCFAVLVDGATVLTRAWSNADMAAESFHHFAAINPGRTLLIFSYVRRDGETLWEKIIARG